MKNFSFLFIAVLIFNLGLAANASEEHIYSSDTIRTAELDDYWDHLAQTVREGDFENYAAAYHEDAVVIFGLQNSVPVAEALSGWKQLFDDTRSGKIKSNVEFRFDNRIGSETTALESGMFLYSTTDANGNKQEQYARFEALLVKKPDGWKMVMENQKSAGTEAEWKALE